LLNQNETMDFNYLRKIKDETGIDIEQIAKDLKEIEVKL
jgi:ADP-ribose pyrophosphatase YjhB (NUDIX family)